MMEICSRTVKLFLTDATLGMVIVFKAFPLDTGRKLSIHKMFTKESAKWRAQRAHVPYVPTCPTCPHVIRAHVPKYISQTGKLKILVLVKSNEGSFIDVFKSAEF